MLQSQKRSIEAMKKNQKTFTSFYTLLQRTHSLFGRQNLN